MEDRVGYYMRFFVEGDRVSSKNALTDVFTRAGAEYQLVDGVLSRGAAQFASIEINRRGDELFQEEIDEFREFLEDADEGPAKVRVLQCLDSAMGTVAVHVLFGNRDTEGTLDARTPLWETLFSRYDGLLQADGEGFYEGDNLILKLE